MIVCSLRHDDFSLAEIRHVFYVQKTNAVVLMIQDHSISKEPKVKMPAIYLKTITVYTLYFRLANCSISSLDSFVYLMIKSIFTPSDSILLAIAI